MSCLQKHFTMLWHGKTDVLSCGKLLRCFAWTHCHLPVPEDRIFAFAKLVAAKEREIQGAALEKILESIRRSERAEEREACAKLCDEFESDTDPDAGAVLAAAIRARGQA